MKKLAYILVYIALSGFAITILANLFSRRDIAALAFCISCILLAKSGIVALLLKLRNINSSNSGKMPPMRKVANFIMYLAVFCTLVGLISGRSGQRHIGRELVIIGLICALCSIALFIFVPFRENRNILNPAIYRRVIILKISGCLSALCIVSGLLFKIIHYSGGEILLLAGFILYLISFIILIYHKNMIKKHPILNIKTIELAPAELAQYLGIYHNDQMKMDITVSINPVGTSLIAQATNQNSFPLSAIEKNIFNYDRAGIVMEFRPEKNQFILIQRGGYFPFIKKI